MIFDRAIQLRCNLWQSSSDLVIAFADEANIEDIFSTPITGDCPLKLLGKYRIAFTFACRMNQGEGFENKKKLKVTIEGKLTTCHWDPPSRRRCVCNKL